jgi:hypothetical protein
LSGGLRWRQQLSDIGLERLGKSIEGLVEVPHDFRLERYGIKRYCPGCGSGPASATFAGFFK